MPQRVICDGCSHVLYEGLELRAPVEIIQQYGGHCPKCGKELRFDSNKITIQKAVS